MKISCEIIQDLLPLYCDEVCSDESRKQIEEHLQECDKCKEDLHLMKDAIQAPSTQEKDEKAAHAAASAWKKGKTRAFVKGCVIAILIAVIFIGSYLAMHWFTTVDENNHYGLAQQAADYLGYDTLYIEEVERRGNYLAVLCTDANGAWCMCVFDKDDVFENRWYASGGIKTLMDGVIGSWNYGSPDGEAVLIFCGGNIPEEVCWYKFQNSKITYICPVEDDTLLDIFIIPDRNDINGYPILLDSDQMEIK